MRRWLSLIVIVGFLTTPARPVSAEEYQEITVQAGDTLWSIANKYLKDPTRWPDIVKHNNLSAADPTVALPGSKLKVPVMLIKEEYRNALLVGVIPEVRYKRKGGADWSVAEKDMTLKYEDSLRTMNGAQARVRFPSKEVVQINENSYVVLKPEKILQEIQLLRGDVRASRAKVIMPGGTVVQPKGGNSDYQAKVRQDDTEVIFVYKGKVDVTAQGKTVTVPEGFGTTVPKSAPPLKPMPLTEFGDFNPAEMTAVAPTSKLDVSQGVVTVSAPQQTADHNSKSKSMMSQDILAAYRLQIATDEKFEKVVLDKQQPTGTTIDIKKQPIPDGRYYMRVAFIDALGAQGKFSQPTEVLKDAIAPLISNLVPEEGHKFSGEEAYCDVIGTAGAALVAVNDEVLFLSPTGRFNKFITLEEGTNLIKIMARDTAGNETLINRKVIYSKNLRAK